MVSIYVAADAVRGEQLHVVGAREKADVVHLRNARHEELHRSGDQIALLVAAERVVERAVDLVQVEIEAAAPVASSLAPPVLSSIARTSASI